MRNESFDLEQRVAELEKRVDALATSLQNYLMYVTPCTPMPQIVNIEPKPMTDEETKAFVEKWNLQIQKK